MPHNRENENKIQKVILIEVTLNKWPSYSAPTIGRSYHSQTTGIPLSSVLDVDSRRRRRQQQLHQQRKSVTLKLPPQSPSLSTSSSSPTTSCSTSYHSENDDEFSDDDSESDTKNCCVIFKEEENIDCSCCQRCWVSPCTKCKSQEKEIEIVPSSPASVANGVRVIEVSAVESQRNCPLTRCCLSCCHNGHFNQDCCLCKGIQSVRRFRAYICHLVEFRENGNSINLAKNVLSKLSFVCFFGCKKSNSQTKANLENPFFVSISKRDSDLKSKQELYHSKKRSIYVFLTWGYKVGHKRSCCWNFGQQMYKVVT